MPHMTTKKSVDAASGRRVAAERNRTAPAPVERRAHAAEDGRLPSDRVPASFDFGKSPPPLVRLVRRSVAAKQIICCKGDPGTHLYVIMAGRVKVSVPSEDGKEITLRILEPGEIFGEVAVLEGARYEATMTAIEQAEVAAMDRRELLDLLEHDPSLTRKLLAAVCIRLRQTTELVEDLTFTALPQRLAKALLALARAYGTQTPRGLRIGLHLCQQELANLIGTSRESVNKQLGAWQEEGLIGMDQGLITIRRLTDDAVRLSAQRTAG